jgi:CO dehydrogenase nickel-insertion accessory protein CooC1
LNPIPEEQDVIEKLIIDDAYTNLENLGRGLIEKVDEICLCHNLSEKNCKLAFQFGAIW